MFDKILLDAPCSSERHVIHDQGAALPKCSRTAPRTPRRCTRFLCVFSEELMAWTTKRTANMAKRQQKLLANALNALKRGGSMVYSTCSISRAENDDLVKRVLQKHSNVRPKRVSGSGARGLRTDAFALACMQVDCQFGERTELGWHILPDTAVPWGPLYFCVLEKAGDPLVDAAEGEDAE
jgi:16S rRNA C967 or C1407 C5-methylase (RsmB/RsmF family)